MVVGVFVTNSFAACRRRRVLIPRVSISPLVVFTRVQYSSEEEEVDLQTALTGYQTKQRKVLEPVDHQKIEYEPYRKNFYVEVPDLAKMTQEGAKLNGWLSSPPPYWCCSLELCIQRVVLRVPLCSACTWSQRS